jgi:hypothetical protein
VAARRAASVAGRAGDGTVGGRADLPAGEKPDAARQKAEKLGVDLSPGGGFWGQGPNYRKRSGERREQVVRRMVLVSFGEGRW